MRTELGLPKRAEFHCRQPDNYILVQNHKDGVMIRATSDNFSEQRKAAFIRELAAEGFIPDHYQWFLDADASNYLAIKWIIDPSWLRVEKRLVGKAELICGRALLLVAIVWLVLIAMILAFT